MQSENKRWFYNNNGKRKHVETFDVEIKKLKNGKTRHINIKISEIKKGTIIYATGFVLIFDLDIKKM